MGPCYGFQVHYNGIGNICPRSEGKKKTKTHKTQKTQQKIPPTKQKQQQQTPPKPELLKFLRLFLDSLLVCLRPLGCQGQHCEQLRKGNVSSSFAIAGERLHPGTRADQAECLPSEACLCSKANCGLFAYEKNARIHYLTLYIICVYTYPAIH